MGTSWGLEGSHGNVVGISWVSWVLVGNSWELCGNMWELCGNFVGTCGIFVGTSWELRLYHRIVA